MKKEKRRFYTAQKKLRAIHIDDPWAEVKLVNKFKKLKRKPKNNNDLSTGE